MSPRDLATTFLRKLKEPNIADQIFDARIDAGLTQQALAKLVGSQQSVIARLEDADYEGHSLAMLRRVAQALGRHLVVELQPESKRGKKPAKGGARTKKAKRSSTR